MEGLRLHHTHRGKGTEDRRLAVCEVTVTLNAERPGPFGNVGMGWTGPQEIIQPQDLEPRPSPQTRHVAQISEGSGDTCCHLGRITLF